MKIKVFKPSFHPAAEHRGIRLIKHTITFTLHKKDKELIFLFINSLFF